MNYDARVEYESFGEYDADRAAILDNGGHIFERPDICLWGFPIHHSEVLDPPVSILTPRSEVDTWFVWYLYGDLRKVWSLIPYKLPLIIFARDHKLRVYSFESLAKKLSR
jgi:hypothetical protein